MGIKMYTIPFYKIPSIKVILDRVRTNTGLLVRYSDRELDHALFNNGVEVVFDEQENQVLLY